MKKRKFLEYLLMFITSYELKIFTYADLLFRENIESTAFDLFK